MKHIPAIIAWLMHVAAALLILAIVIVPFVPVPAGADETGPAFALAGIAILTTPVIFGSALLTLILFRHKRRTHFWLAAAYVLLLLVSQVSLYWYASQPVHEIEVPSYIAPV